MNNHIAYISLGANLGAALATLHKAINEIDSSTGIGTIEVSNIYDTSPVDSSGPNYVNAVARVTTALSAPELLHLLQAIELQHGRTRPYKNAPRTLDLDLLLYDDEKINTTELIVPHPRMHERAFVIKPLMDLDPKLQLAQGNLTDLLIECSDQSITLLESWNHKQ